MARRTPTGPPPPPVVQRVRVRYAKRGRLRFASHRDFARALERAVRRAGVPIAYSAGFSPHPRISYIGAAPTGAASEAEYLELALSQRVDVDALREALDEALPDGLDVLDAVEAGPGSLAERMELSHWRIELPGADAAGLAEAVAAFLAAEAVVVQRPTKDGVRDVDTREAALVLAVGAAPAAVPPAEVPAPAGGAGDAPGVSPAGAVVASRAILDLVVRQVIPAVRPDDVLAALRALTGFVAPQPPRATRVAQGPMTGTAPVTVGDPLVPDRRAGAADAPAG